MKIFYGVFKGCFNFIISFSILILSTNEAFAGSGGTLRDTTIYISPTGTGTGHSSNSPTNLNFVYPSDANTSACTLLLQAGTYQNADSATRPGLVTFSGHGYPLTLDKDPSTTGDITFNGTCSNNTHMRFGISISATDSITHVNNITIKNIKFINIRENAIAVKGYRSITSGFVNHINTVSVEYCYVSSIKGRIDDLSISSAAMLFQKTQNITIRHSGIELLDDVIAQTDGIFINDTCSNIIITDDTLRTKNNASDLPHIDCIQIVDGNKILIERNFIISNSDIHTDVNRVCINIVRPVDSVRIYNNNVVSERGSDLINLHYKDASKVYIYNNTFYGRGGMSTLLYFNQTESGIQEFKIHNNILLFGSSTDKVLAKFDGVSSLDQGVMDYNIGWNKSDTVLNVRIGGVLYSWKTTFGDVHGQKADPKLYTTTDQDIYFTSSKSPCKDAGEYISAIPNDIIGNKRPYWQTNSFDQGAFEVPNPVLRIGSSSSGTTFRISSLGALWERNSSDQFVVSNNSNLITSTFQTTEAADTNQYRWWKGWEYGWMNQGSTDSNAVNGLGIYKVMLGTDSTRYIIIDLRDSYFSDELPVGIGYSNNQQSFQIKYSSWSSVINQGVFRIWDIHNTTPNTSNLNNYWSKALVVANNNNHPQLIWGPYPSVSSSVSKFIIHRKYGASPWEIKDSTSSNTYEFIDNSISITLPGGEAGANVYYYIEARLNTIPVTHDNTDTIYVNNPEKEKEKKNSGLVQNGYELSNNYPNPFNPSTIIRFSVAEEVLVNLKIYNILGQEIKTLLNEVKAPGDYEVNFDSGSLASGIYIYSLKAGNYSAIKKMQLVR